MYTQTIQDFFKTLESIKDDLLRNNDIPENEPKINDLISCDTSRDLEIYSKMFSEKTLTVSVFGLHNSGKSTLVNSLLGQKYA